MGGMDSDTKHPIMEDTDIPPLDTQFRVVLRAEYYTFNQLVVKRLKKQTVT